MTDADIRFYFDPVCPFAWMTSKWVRMVAAQRDYTVDWRLISLPLINPDVDYDAQPRPDTRTRAHLDSGCCASQREPSTAPLPSARCMWRLAAISSTRSEPRS